MSEKREFLSRLREEMIHSRKSNDEFIQSLPDTNQPKNTPFFTPYIDGNFAFKEVTSDNLKKVRAIGESVLNIVFTEFEDKISIDLKGHDKTSNKSLTLKNSTSKQINRYRLTNYLSHKIGRVIISLPLGEIEMTTIKILELSMTLFDYDYEEFICVTDEQFTCRSCGEHLKALFDIDSLTISLYEDLGLSSPDKSRRTTPLECKYPDGVKEFTDSISTPSKKIVIANDLRDLLPDIGMTDDDYLESKFDRYMTISMSQLAHVYHTEYYAKKHNMLYVQSGDGGVAIFQNTNNLSVEIKPENMYIDNEDVFNAKPNEKYVGSVSFALWAINAMDYDQFVNLCIKKHPGGNIEDLINYYEAVLVNTDKDKIDFTSHYFSRNKDTGLLLSIS